MKSLGSIGLSSQSVSGFSGRKGPDKKPVLGFSGRKGPKNLEMGGVFWPKRAQENLKRTGMTSLGSPGLSSESVSRFSGRKGPTKTRNRLGRQAWEAQSCHPTPFRGFLAEKAQQKLETDWDDKLGKPRLVILVRFVVFWKRAKKPETDWDDKSGKPRLVIPVCFGFFWPKRAQKP